MATTAVPQRRLVLSEANGRPAGSLAFVPVAREPLLVESVQRTPSPFSFSIFPFPSPAAEPPQTTPPPPPPTHSTTAPAQSSESTPKNRTASVSIHAILRPHPPAQSQPHP